jgi:hypothetical protein
MSVAFNENGTATVTQMSLISGKISTRILRMTKDQYDRWFGGTLIQDALPHLTPMEREFLMTGMTEAEWDAEFGNDE